VDALIQLGTEVVGGRELEADSFRKFQPDEYANVFSKGNIEFSTLYVHTPLRLYSPGHHEEATRMWIYDQSVIEDTPPVAIFCEYGIFEKSESPRHVTPKIEKVGNQVVKFFWEVIEVIRPAYAAILGGADWLECPTELKHQRGSTSFRNFFVSTEYFGVETTDYIRELYKGAYIKELTRGPYISCSPFFNPDHIWLELRAVLPQRWDEVARIIGSMA
jgi:hypothetical protein